MHIEKDPKKIVDDLIFVRNRAFNDYLIGKSTNITFAYRTYTYIKQKHYKCAKKAHDIYSIILNYIYWISIIERRTMVERLLIQDGLGSKEQLDNIIEMAIVRKNQMVRRLLYEFDNELKIESMNLVFKNTVELKFVGINMFFYVDLSVLEKLGISVDEYSRSLNNSYLPFIFIELPINK